MAWDWEQLENMKQEALHNDNLGRALFFQNEQLMMKLNSVTWYLKKMEERAENGI